VVERILGKAEVGSSILPSSTIPPAAASAKALRGRSDLYLIASGCGLSGQRLSSPALRGYQPRFLIPLARFRGDCPMSENTDERLRLLIERVERLEEEKKGIGDDIKDVYAEGKAVGYDAKIMRKVVALRKMKPDDRREMETVLDLYKAALGLE
jgi:uncharacterized protein (UPF0335 family)